MHFRLRLRLGPPAAAGEGNNERGAAALAERRSAIRRLLIAVMKYFYWRSDWAENWAQLILASRAV